jgi:hypothetical protein
MQRSGPSRRCRTTRRPASARPAGTALLALRLDDEQQRWQLDVLHGLQQQRGALDVLHRRDYR